jgi:hypothetical protein
MNAFKKLIAHRITPITGISEEIAQILPRRTAVRLEGLGQEPMPCPAVAPWQGIPLASLIFVAFDVRDRIRPVSR